MVQSLSAKSRQHGANGQPGLLFPQESNGRLRKHSLPGYAHRLDQPRGIRLLEMPGRLIFIGKEDSKSNSFLPSILAIYCSGGTRHAYKIGQVPLRDEMNTTDLAAADASHRSLQACLEEALVHSAAADSNLISYQGSIDRWSFQTRYQLH